MKKKLIFAAGAMVIAAAVSAAFCLNFGQTRHDDLFEQNLDALARGENDANLREEECYEQGGNYNMASICVDSGFETVECEISGQISAVGVTISGSYKRGKKYSIAWARYTCTHISGNCCVKQGLYSGEEKLA